MIQRIHRLFRFTVGISALMCGFSGISYAQKQSTDFSRYVNPFIGTAPLTDSAILGYKLPEGWRSWAGLVFPGSALPNAMVQLSPITEYGSGAGYEYEDTMIYGFTHTNKGHWNLCNIPLLPVSGKIHQDGKFGSGFSHKKESASPAFYQVFLDDYKVNVSLTSTARCGYHRYEYSNNKNRQILFDLSRANNRVTDWKIAQVDDFTVEGYQDISEYKIYFYAKLNGKIREIRKEGEGTGKGNALVSLADNGSGPVDVKIGISFVSTQNAKLNLEKEVADKSFDQVLKEGKQTWEAFLSKIQVTGGTEKQKQLFYSSLYRMALWPTLRSDVNGEYTDEKGKVVKADFNYYTIPSLWDTYRNKDVLLSILSPRVTVDIIKSLKDIGDKTGFIPTFFHGDHAASFIAGSYLRGLNDFDVKGTYQLLLRNANLEGGTRPFIKEYISKGYISEPDIQSPHVETKAKAGVSKTLEYAYDDYSLAQLAKRLGDTANYRILMERSKNYKNVFDPSTRFMRGKLANGEWVKNFNPQYPYYEYMYREANAWQVSFFAPHDMDGLISLYGGAGNFESKLDSLFSVPWNPQYIARNVETMVGQYCHGNQPDHEAPFAYYFIGKPEKSQKMVDYILNNLYGIGDDGLTLCGMDDAGEMSSWYVFSALGLYPYCAADPEYMVLVPHFDEVKWKLNNGRTLTLRKDGKGRRMTGLTVDRKAHKGYFIPHELFNKGGEIIVRTAE
ncbi:GH92 family glycosyl hydrolase [Pararcticibacter amylolyticus]|uniref:Glycoside hydrolase family 92 protein n=1 Tax=Pararcticibacter amylolyticus TaxID=2173175 RepID=A0A2U2PLZ3_9SPHI|nr:GH92 family glycosyl hydrolase [Pararcticibacter amylolyticus]PWG82199.1 glycoside hydrolase family 92 protein [Pararcticibacter amylolyticus]